MPSLNNVQCFPINQKTLNITFEKSVATISQFTIFISPDKPQKWDTDFKDSNVSWFRFTKLVPFQMYNIYLRGMESMHSAKGFVKLTKLSKGVKCGSQGRKCFDQNLNIGENSLKLTFYSHTVSVSYVSSQDGIFVWWHPPTTVNVSSYLLQIDSGDDETSIKFADQVVGSSKIFDEKYINWNEVNSSLYAFNITSRIIEAKDTIRRQKRFVSLYNNQQSLSVSNENKRNRKHKGIRDVSNREITELKLPGNVTGVLIPNTSKLNVRLLVQVNEDEDEDELINQNLDYMEWTTVSS